jgi:hypothetical protein
MNCYYCLQTEYRVPRLLCGHFLCPSCYCALKRDGISNCLICDKVLLRGKRKVGSKMREGDGINP